MGSISHNERMTFDLTYKRYGACSILVEWPQNIDRETLIDVLSLKRKIMDTKVKSIVNVVSAYNSLLITYEYIDFNFEKAIKTLKSLHHQKNNVRKTEFYNKWRIPVCYDLLFGIDLEEISKVKNQSIDEIILLHSQTNYTVYFIGFLPGFLYLGGLDKSLHVPRKETPRLKIEKGAVAIGGEQTGVYPAGESRRLEYYWKYTIDFF